MLQFLRKESEAAPRVTVRVVSFEEGQSRRRVLVALTMVLVEIGGVEVVVGGLVGSGDEVEVEVEVLEAAAAVAPTTVGRVLVGMDRGVGLVLALLASEPPIPPPRAAARTTMAPRMSRSQNVLRRRPQVRAG